MSSFQLNFNKNDLPRERMIKFGAQALNDYELVSILLGTGTKFKSVLSISNDMLKEYGSFTKLSKLNRHELMKIEGIGISKACKIIAVFEIFRRLDREKYVKKIKLNSPKRIFEFMIDKYRYKDREYLYVLSLDSRNNLIAYDLVSVGTTNMTLAHPREIFKFAIKNSASSIILTHNHPSGSLTPSKADISLTKNILNVSNTVDIPLLDHIIITDTGYYSLKSNNYM